MLCALFDSMACFAAEKGATPLPNDASFLLGFYTQFAPMKKDFLPRVLAKWTLLLD